MFAEAAALTLFTIKLLTFVWAETFGASGTASNVSNEGCEARLETRLQTRLNKRLDLLSRQDFGR